MIELLLQAEAALSVGLLDRAETLYRQVASADPRNSMAVVGLSRVALERSDEVGALTLARRALSIDPENDAAQRMAQRLEEVLRYRGVVVAPAPVAEPAPPSRQSEPAREPAPPMPAREPAPAPKRAESDPPPGHRSYLDRLLRRR